MKKVIAILLAACCVFLCITMVSAGSEDSLMHRLGISMKEFRDNMDAEGKDQSEVVAMYGSHEITRAVIEQNRSALLLSEEGSGADLTDRELVDLVAERIILREEAERLGLSATQEEIDSFVQDQKSTYEIPEVKQYLDDYCSGAEMSIDDYFAYVEQIAPSYIAKQKLRKEIGRQYCEEHGLEYTNVNPPQEMLDAIEAYIGALFEAHRGDIVYYIDD